MNRQLFFGRSVFRTALVGWALCGVNPGCTSGGQDGAGGGESGSSSGGAAAAGEGGDGGNEPSAGGQAGTDPETGGATQAGGTTASGGTPVTGGVNGQGGAAAGGAGGAPAAGTCGAALFCDDFEKPGKGERPAAPLSAGINAGDSLAIDDTRAFSGTKSVRIVATKEGSTAMSLAVKDLLPSAQKISYARMMLWMENRPGDSGHWDVLTMQGPAMGGGANWVSRFSFGGFGDNQSKLLYYSNSSTGGLADCSKAGSPQIPLGQWVCVEMAIDETVANHYTVKVNDRIIPGGSFKDTSAASNCCCGSTNNNTWYVPDVLSVKFGWGQAHAQLRPVTFWIDDIAVAEKPIGCPKK